jgi:hypothetical protein
MEQEIITSLTAMNEARDVLREHSASLRVRFELLLQPYLSVGKQVDIRKMGPGYGAFAVRGRAYGTLFLSLGSPHVLIDDKRLSLSKWQLEAVSIKDDGKEVATILGKSFLLQGRVMPSPVPDGPNSDIEIITWGVEWLRRNV